MKVKDKYELEVEDAGCNLEAANQCPVNAIHVTDRDQKSYSPRLSTPITRFCCGGTAKRTFAKSELG